MSKEQIAPAVSPKDYLLKRLSDPATAAAYINTAAREDDPGALLQALRNVAEAHGGIAKIAARAGLNRQQLYRTLSSEGNPELRSLTKILDATGLQLEITAKPVRKTKRRAAVALAA